MYRNKSKHNKNKMKEMFTPKSSKKSNSTPPSTPSSLRQEDNSSPPPASPSTPRRNTATLSNEELIIKINALERRVDILESQLLITQNVNKHLQSKIDDQEQYSRRPCLVVNGMKKPGNEDDENNDFEAVIETLAKESNIREDTIRENVEMVINFKLSNSRVTVSKKLSSNAIKVVPKPTLRIKKRRRNHLR